MTAFFYWDVISWALSLMLSDRYVNNDGFFVLNLYLNIIHWSFSSMIGRHSVTPNFSIFFLASTLVFWQVKHLESKNSVNGNIEQPLDSGPAGQVQLVATVEGVDQLEGVNCQ